MSVKREQREEIKKSHQRIKTGRYNKGISFTEYIQKLKFKAGKIAQKILLVSLGRSIPGGRDRCHHLTLNNYEHLKADHL